MIREPYNVSPYNEAKDLSQNPQFSFTFGGDALVGYDYKILDNSNKNNILKDWSSVASTVTGENIKYLPTIDSGAVAIPTTQLGQTVTIYNDEDYYFDCANILNSDLYTNKGLVWKLRLFEDNTTPSNIIQSGEITNVLSLQDGEAIVKGTITGLLEESDSYIFKNNPNYSPTLYPDPNDESQNIEGYIPDRWTRNVLKIGQNSFPINDYETHTEQYYNTQKPDTYFVGTKAIGNGNSEVYYTPVKNLSYYTYNYSYDASNKTYQCIASSHAAASTLVRSNISGIVENAIVKDSTGAIVSISDKVTGRDLFNATNNNKSISYSLGSTSIVTEQVTNNGVQDIVNATYDVVWGSTGENKKNSNLYNFTVKQEITSYDSNGAPIVTENILTGTRSLLGMSNLLYIDAKTGSYRNGSSYLTEEEIAAIQGKALASTTIDLLNSSTYSTLSEEDIDFNKDNETTIYTVELEDEKIQYNKTTSTNEILTREKAKKKGIIDKNAADILIILSSTDSSVDSSNTFFTYDEISNIKDSDYGLYTLGRGLSDDKLSLISPKDSINQIGELTGNQVLYFTVLNNYYDSNYYYFTNQKQPDINFQINDVPYYSFLAYSEQIAAGNKPTSSEHGLLNHFTFQKSKTQILPLSNSSVGSEDNPLVTLQRFFPIVSSLAGMPYNFKYYKFKIQGGTINEKGTVIYNSTPLYESGKIFSRSILIDYNNYVTDYDRYRIELMLATSENGFYYYYTYLYPTIDMFQNDEKDDHFASVSYDEEKGAAKISWTKDNAYPPALKGVEITEYGTYIVNGKKFPLKAYKISEDGYMTYYHKGSEILNINPLHDFQISFTIDKVLKGLDKITIDPLIAFNNTQNTTVISLSVEDNIIELMEDNVTIKSSKNTIIETAQSFIDWDDDDTHKNQIFQYRLPEATNKTEDVLLPTSGVLAPTEQDLSKYCFHFYLFPWSTKGSNEAKASYKITRFYNVDSCATNELIMESEDEWRLGFYGEGAGNNADLSNGSNNLPSGPTKTNFDTSKYISVSYLLSGGRPTSQMLNGLSKINLYGEVLYYGILDINRRGIIASEDNFILNFNDSSVGFSSLSREVYGYRIFRNVYENDNVNSRDMALDFMRQMDTVYASICGAITLDDSNHSPLGKYENIVDTATYVQGWDENGNAIGYIRGADLRALVNDSFTDLRQAMDEYFAGKDLSFNFNTEPFDEIYSLLDSIQTPNMIANDMIADINIFNYTISEEAGQYYIYDYNIPSNGYFRYQIVPLLRDKTYNVLIAKTNNNGETIIYIDDEQWHMTDIKKRADGSYAPGDTWNFLLGVQSAQYTQNFTKTFQTGFAPYPKVMTSMANYKTTQFTGYLGKFSFRNGGSNVYEDTIERIEKWNEFAYAHNQILVKDPKGHVFIAAISATSDISDAAIPEMPTQVTCTLTQVGDIDSFKVYSL